MRKQTSVVGKTLRRADCEFCIQLMNLYIRMGTDRSGKRRHSCAGHSQMARSGEFIIHGRRRVPVQDTNHKVLPFRPEIRITKKRLRHIVKVTGVRRAPHPLYIESGSVFAEPF